MYLPTCGLVMHREESAALHLPFSKTNVTVNMAQVVEPQL